MKYNFYGNECNIKPINNEYNVKSIRDLYDKLSLIWSRETCAPRMRDRWSSSNKTVGQCSITAFLCQDIFGGDVYGIKLDDGNYHCYNVVNGFIFDLTSEQFDYDLVYEKNNLQDRLIHFQKEEKKNRYIYLCNALRSTKDEI